VKRLFNLFKSFISECEAYAIAFIIIIGIHLSVLIDLLTTIAQRIITNIVLTVHLYSNRKLNNLFIFHLPFFFFFIIQIKILC
jgi:hypothetical protein